MKKYPQFIAIHLLLAIALTTQAQQQPPASQPGKCMVQGLTPPQFETIDRRVLVRPAYKTYEAVPAEYRTVDVRIMVKPPSKKYVYVPAEFETVVEMVAVKDAATQVELVPPTFDTLYETIETRPPTARWEYRYPPGDCKSEDPRDCLVLQYVERPGAYLKIPTLKPRTSAGFRTAPGTGDSIRIEKQRLVREARVEEVEIPAEYITVQRQELVRDAYVREVEVPAQYRLEPIQVLKDPGGQPFWAEVDCHLTEYNELPITFDEGSANLSPTATSVLRREILPFMQKSPGLQVEIAAHTDSRGDAAANLQLSQKRAEAIVNWLVAQGIPPELLIAKGFGETRLKNHCADGVKCTELEHAQNRRVEWRVVPYLPK